MDGRKMSPLERAAMVRAKVCPACGREHTMPDIRIELEKGAISRLPQICRELGISNPFLLMDENTRKAAGNTVMELLGRAGLPYMPVCLPAEPKLQADTDVLPELQMKAKGNDFILGVGSGVINDICKMLGLYAGVRTGIIATAPSMDGYASNSSAMIVDGVKTTLYNHTPALVLGDRTAQRSAILCLYHKRQAAKRPQARTSRNAGEF